MDGESGRSGARATRLDYLDCIPAGRNVKFRGGGCSRGVSTAMVSSSVCSARTLRRGAGDSDTGNTPASEHTDHQPPAQRCDRYEWIASAPPATAEQLRERWSAVETRNLNGEAVGLNWAVRRQRDGVYVGKLDAEIEAGVATNVGHIVFPDSWKQGYAREALAGLIAHLAQHDIRELHAYVTNGNVDSEHVLLRAGFERRRVLIDSERIRGVTYDDVEYVRE